MAERFLRKVGTGATKQKARRVSVSKRHTYKWSLYHKNEWAEVQQSAKTEEDPRLLKS